MRVYYTLIFGILLTFFMLSVLFVNVKNDLIFVNKKNIDNVIGIIDSTYYIGGVGGGSSLTVRVKYIVNNKIYYTTPKTVIFFKYENLIGNKINVIYLKNNPSISKINTFRERAGFIICAIFFILIGLLMTIKSEGLALLRSRKNKTKPNS